MKKSDTGLLPAQQPLETSDVRFHGKERSTADKLTSESSLQEAS